MNNDWREFYDPQYVLMHHGIKGQRWGVRRFQNADGTLTAKGQKRYGDKVTMHNGKTNLFVGGRKYQSHKEYTTANNFAKGTYLQRKQEIKDQKKADLAKADTFGKKVGANLKAMAKNRDNTEQYRYELARNRQNAGVSEFKREVVKGTVTNTAKAAAKVGAGVVAGMLTANYMNNKMKREGAGTLTMKGMDNYYEYKVGKKEVAKVLGKAVAMGAIYGATKGFTDSYNAQERVDRVNKYEKDMGVKNTRAKRAAEDEKRWKKGQV